MWRSELRARLGDIPVSARLTTESDQVEVFGVTEFVLPLPKGMTRAHTAGVMFDNRVAAQVLNDGRVLRFRFSPRDAMQL